MAYYDPNAGYMEEDELFRRKGSEGGGSERSISPYPAKPKEQKSEGFTWEEKLGLGLGLGALGIATGGFLGAVGVAGSVWSGTGAAIGFGVGASTAAALPQEQTAGQAAPQVGPALQGVGNVAMSAGLQGTGGGEAPAERRFVDDPIAGAPGGPGGGGKGAFKIPGKFEQQRLDREIEGITKMEEEMPEGKAHPIVGRRDEQGRLAYGSPEMMGRQGVTLERALGRTPYSRPGARPITSALAPARPPELEPERPPEMRGLGLPDRARRGYTPGAQQRTEAAGRFFPDPHAGPSGQGGVIGGRAPMGQIQATSPDPWGAGDMVEGEYFGTSPRSPGLGRKAPSVPRPGTPEYNNMLVDLRARAAQGDGAAKRKLEALGTW